MKNLIRLLVVTILTGFSISCSKDDSPQPLPQAAQVDTLEALKSNLIGKWQYEKLGSIVNGNEVLVDYLHRCSTIKDNFILGLDNSYNPNDFNSACVESALGNNIYFIKITNSSKILNFAGFDNKIISISATEMKINNLTSGFIYVLKKV